MEFSPLRYENDFMPERDPQFNEIANREAIEQMLKEHPPFVAEYQRMIASFDERIKQMKEFFTKYEENEGSQVVGYMSEIRLTTEAFANLHHQRNTAEILKEYLDNRKSENYEHFLEGEWGTWTRLLRADAVLQSYVLPCLKPMPEGVKLLANTLHTMVTDLQTFMASQNGVPDQLAYLQPAPEGVKCDRDHIERWLHAAQKGPTDFRTQLRNHIINTAEAQLQQAEVEGKPKPEIITGVQTWGYTWQGHRERVSEVQVYRRFAMEQGL